jgi:putative acetyltransferase
MAALVGLGCEALLPPLQASSAKRGARRMSEAVKAVTVVPYRKEFKDVFERLNRAWIEEYFVLEPADREVFDDPESKVVAPGGQIFFVLEDDQVQGTCAVVWQGSAECEIAKMAVAPEARGRGYGDLLMETAIRFATDRGARRAIIVSNTLLEPAIRLYEKHGFMRVPLSIDERYSRANIRLERELSATGPGGHPAGA